MHDDGGLSDRLDSGTDIEALKALRELLSARLRSAEPKEAAGLSREYRAVLADLRRLGATREEDAVDELAAARERRRARPTGTEDPGGPTGR